MKVVFDSCRVVSVIQYFITGVLGAFISSLSLDFKCCETRGNAGR